MPPVSDRQRAKRRIGLAVGDHRSQVRRPFLELPGNLGRTGACIAKVDRANPVFGLVQCRVARGQSRPGSDAS